MNTYDIILIGGIHTVFVTTAAGDTFKVNGYADYALAARYVDTCIALDNKPRRPIF